MADELNFQIPKQGYDSYLYGIIPDDQAVLAGAFSVSMQQIRNIDNINLPDFAKVAFSMESTVGLPLTGGTDIPTDTPLSTVAKIKTALGSGVYGTYTMSNFLGAMSGLPYPWQSIYEKILELQTIKLINIYQELYLAVKWAQANPDVTVIKETYAVQNGNTGGSNPQPLYDYYYTITSATWTGTAGGGYGRGNAPAPTGIITGGSGATVITTIDNNPNNVPGTYGQVITVALSSAGSAVMYSSGNLSPNPTTPPATPVQLQAPPTDILPVQGNGNKATGGMNTPFNTNGWLVMNSVVQNYINQSNDEIQAITTSSAQNFVASNVLNTLWNITGIALKHEQRARYIAIPPVDVPYDNRASDYPTALIVFVDSLPNLAKQTLPHMAVQTLEHISDLRIVGGQSIIAMMRQERNQDRLAEIGIELDNNLNDDLDEPLKEQLLVNGTLCGAVEGVESENGCIYTLPAWPENTNPYAYFDGETKLVEETTNGNIIILMLGDDYPIMNPEVPIGPSIVIDPTLIDNTPNYQLPNRLPVELDTTYTGTPLLPSTYSVSDAIDKVIECNCDCWV